MGSVEMICHVCGGCRSPSAVNNNGSTDWVVDIEDGVDEDRISVETMEGECCRICMLSLDSESGTVFELGCSCKNDLAAVHQQCAEEWFISKGNNVCEICHSIAKNVIIPSDIESSQQISQVNTLSDIEWSQQISQVNTFSTNAVPVPVFQVNTSTTNALLQPPVSATNAVSLSQVYTSSTNAILVSAVSSTNTFAFPAVSSTSSSRERRPTFVDDLVDGLLFFIFLLFVLWLFLN